MQTQVQKPESIRLWSGVFKIDWVNIWVMKDAGLEATTLIWQIKWHNGKLPPRQKLDWLKFKGTMIEINLENVNKVFGWEFSSVAWNPVVVTWESHGTGWVVWTPFKLNNKNGDNTIVASITIKAGWSALVLNTDYRTYVWDWVNGELWYTYIVPLTAQTLAITADYTYTPYAKKVITYDDLIRVISMYPIEFINTDANGKQFWVKIFQAYATNSINFNFPSDDDIEASLELPMEFWAYPDSNNKYYEIIDEQDVI